jgi:hypothetical protein
MQNAEIEIAARNPSEAIEAAINQTAEKYKVDVIQVKRYSAYQISYFCSTVDSGPLFRVSLDFESDPNKFDDGCAEEGFIGSDWDG